MKFNLFNTKARTPEFNINHPDIAHKVEEAFKSGGKQYYRFTEEHQMPTGRYKWVLNYLREVDLRMDIETFKGYLKDLKSALNPGEKQVIDLEKAWKTILNMESRANLAFEVEGVRRLASVIFFDESEDLSGYDLKYNKIKVKSWENNNTLDFFLTMPICELLGTKNISIESLEEFIQNSTEIIRDLNYGQQNPSRENL
jgi:hypothetical protein